MYEGLVLLNTPPLYHSFPCHLSIINLPSPWWWCYSVPWLAGVKDKLSLFDALYGALIKSSLKPKYYQ